MKHLSATISAILLLSLSISALQAQNKVPLDHEDFDQWRSISGQTLTPDARFLIYGLNPQEGDGEIIVRNLNRNRDRPLERGERFQVSHDGRTLVYFIAAPHQEQRQARIDGKRPSNVFEDTLAIYKVYDEILEKIPQVDSFKFPEKSGLWLAYLFDRDLKEDDENNDSENGESEENGNEDEKQIPEKTENDLVLRNLQTGNETMIHNVEDYFFTRHGERLVYVTADEDSLQAQGVHFIDTQSGNQVTISSGLESYRSVTMDSTGSRIAFLAQIPDEEEDNANGDEEKKDEDEDAPEYYTLFFWQDGMDEAVALVNEESDWLPGNWMVNEYASPSFSHDGSRLFFGTAPEPMRRDQRVEEIDIASVDIWHWQDDRLQSQQLVQLRRDQRRTFRNVYHIDADSFVQLEDHSLETVTVPDRGNARYAVGMQNRHYLHLVQWKGFPAFTDIYRVDVETGERTQMGERVKASISYSPDGKFIAWYDFKTQDWHATNLESMQTVNLTVHIDVAFYNELHDAPSDPFPYGVEGWTENDRQVIIRDRYDLWVFDPTGNDVPFMLTNGYGRQNEITYRAFSEDRQSRYFSNHDVYMTGMYDKDKSMSINKIRFGFGNNPNELWRGDNRVFTPQKARDTDRWMVRKSTFQDFPDIHLTNNNFRRFNRVTHANPQQEKYLWGDVELFHFRSLDGDKLEGLLYTPENFDPNKKYPVIVYFYERTSNRLHNYRAPAPSASTITPAFYTSRGYVVAMPDIKYRIGNPGRSAEDAVIGMTLHLIDRGFVDEDRIGLQGQSWGGYQIAHIITRTNMFAAAMAGAPVSNMVSAYGGIRWGSGLNRQFQYEKTQSRIGGSLWERPMQYVENSPIFFADRVETPLLMMHNDDDGAVPWYQGIEFFTALKRLGQPVWMLNYNNEAHNLRERVNRKDLSRRMQQFFDHYLMDAPQPVWMKYGVPAIEKGKHQGFDLVK